VAGGALATVPHVGGRCIQGDEGTWLRRAACVTQVRVHGAVDPSSPREQPAFRND